uniref:Carbohydrate esterase putative n=1 Tax=Albugo laibachii Nc14 TaxID=890382 RepID=F0W9J3_9STRA|nr:carbohydrate esterase putative [Albugo laibachii Nc14]|eukprot:CCA17807.1 carbohydrate esterase putative [Albugo laibachii Nc14]
MSATDRRKLIDQSIRFLQHPTVRDTPLSEKLKFLEKKGLTSQETSIALKEYEEAVSNRANQIAASMTGMKSGSRLLDRVGVIVGGLSDFGYLVSLRLSQEGAKISILDLIASKAIGKQYEADWKIFYGESYDWDFLDGTFTTIARQFGRIDFIVNCIPVPNIPMQRIFESDTTIQDMFVGTAAHATFLSCKRAIQQMTQQKGTICGRILNITSVPIKHPSRASLEAAVITHLTRYIATEYGSNGILCNSIAANSTFLPVVSASGLNHAPSSDNVNYGEDATNIVLHFVSDQIQCTKGVNVLLDKIA